ncbi:uncharacterized protein ColSpa_02001 [Colletotrichum spaethianum]|uniref:Uncharacterized protein n=1 Tax=Colletotrichum spaethianum TaxID=700344 RepID=A0AA37L7Z9_9PEZI|nr:uncharacterized protein ColSpa_02001 [Colletotrichum spaethianum]GKT41820.1 hypothetical protein ColSpa_02001 [Colletotrichum spaethianum]
MTATAAQHGSTTPRGSRSRSRSDSLQKMLELEHARKLERLQGHQSMPVYTHPSHLAFQQVLQHHVNQGRPPQSPPRLSPFPTISPPPPVKPLVPLQSRRRESSVQIPVKKTDLPPSAMKAARRATALPSLSISVPPPPSNTKTQIDREAERKEAVEHKHKTVTFLDVDVLEEPTADDASSICHSPSWESFGQNKKKEKKNEAKMRKKEKEQAEKQVEKEAKSVKKMLAAKLTKTPPSRPPNASRSISSPTTFADDRLRSSSAQAFYEPPPPIRPQHTRQRSDSVAMQLKAALTGYKTPSQSQPDESHGFIGGLKLEQKRQAAAGMPLRKPVPPASLAHQRANSFGPEVMVTPPAFTAPSLLRSTSYGLEAEINKHQEDDAFAPRTPRVASMHVPSWCQPLVSPTAPPVPDGGNLQQWKSNAAQQQDSAVADDDDELEPPPALSEFVLEQERGRRRESYVHQSRQQSRERSINGFKDETRVSSAKSHYPPQTNRQHQSSSHSSPSNSSTLSGNYPPRSGSTTSLSAHNDQSSQAEDFTITFRLPYTPPAHGSPNQGSFDRSISQGPPASRLIPKEIPLPSVRSSSREKPPSTPGAAIRSFKDAAKAAFYKVSSPGPSRPPVSNYFTRAVRENTMTPDSPSSSRYSTDEPSPLPAEPVRPFAASGESSMPSRDSSARPTDRSSMSSCDEGLPTSSTATTPDSSRPQSEKGLMPVDGEVGRVDNATVLVSDDSRSYRLSHTALLACSPTVSNPRISLPPQIPVQNHEAHLNELEALVTEKFGRNASVADAEDSDSSQSYPTPTHTESSVFPSPLTSASLTSPQEYDQREQRQAENVAAPVQDAPSCAVQRQPSLTKSRSSPDLVLDTSFLPKLKHQPLVPRALIPAPPPRSSKRGSVSNLAGKAATQAAQPSDAAWRKSAVALKAPANPSSYLEEARKSMQGPPGPPRSNRVSRASIVPPNGAPEPVAKMLVECCSCKFLHDMPSKVYECMANPEGKVEDRKLGVSGVISTTVKCPWCSHGMTTRCCAGYAAVIYLKEKLH